MPRNGMLVRITLALAAAATLGAIAVSAAGAARSSTTLTGAGSTFVAPLITTWSTGNPAPIASLGLSINYGGGGSGAGVSQITNHQVDFGASDAPLTAFANTCHTCIQIPWALSGTAIIYNLAGHPGLHMTGNVLARIYLGQITYWDDPAIKALNKGQSLPHTQIITVHRDASSGTTYNFTDYLSSASPNFRGAIGVSTFPSWPSGVAGHGSSGVATQVANNPGAIGYVDVYYGVSAHLKFMYVKNRSGVYTQPHLPNIAAAALFDSHPSKTGALSIVNPPASKRYRTAYPISTYTYVDVQKKSTQAAALKKFLNWAVTTGQKYAKQDIFQPLPKSVVTFDKAQIKKIQQG